MGKIAVKLSHPDSVLLDDDGVRFVPHETKLVEESERITQCLKINALVRDREKEVELLKAETKKSTPVKAETEQPLKDSNEKK